MIKIIRILKYLLIIAIVSLVVAFAIIVNKRNKSDIVDTKKDNLISDKQMYKNYKPFSDEYIYYKFGVKDLTDEEKEQMLYYNEHINEMLLQMMKKGGNWRIFPVIKDIKEEYDEKKGLLAEFDFDNIEYSKETLDILNEYGSAGRVSIIGTKDKQKKTGLYVVSN